jgi:hypothetical protein
MRSNRAVLFSLTQLRVGLVVVCIGLYLLAKAGQQKEQEQKHLHEPLLDPNESTPLNSSNADWETKQSSKCVYVSLLLFLCRCRAVASSRDFKLGIAACIISGVFSPMLNLAMAFGEYARRIDVATFYAFIARS